MSDYTQKSLQHITEMRGDTEFILCIQCEKEWVDTDAIWVGEPRGARCEKCVPNINGEY